MNHKEWMKQCIDECKRKGEFVTSGAAEFLIEKFAAHMDEEGGGSGGALSVVIEMAFDNGPVYTCDTAHADIVEALSAKKHVSIVLVDFNIGASTAMQMYALKDLGLKKDGEIHMRFEQDHMITFYSDGTLGETVFE